MKKESYTPERHAAEEKKITEVFLKDVPAYVLQHVRSVVRSKLDQEGQQIWERLIGSYPMLKRVADYVYSPVEAFDIRIDLLRRWTEADTEQNSFLSPYAIQDRIFIEWILNSHQELLNKPIGTFLRNMADDFSCVLQADLRKAAGHPDSIETLRENWKKEETEGEKTLITIDQSPFYRIENLDFPDKIEIHLYVLEENATDSLFTEADSYLTEYFQWFYKSNVIDKSQCWAYIYEASGNLANPPGKHQNPFEFNIVEKYKGLVISVAKKQESSVENSLQDKAEDLAVKDHNASETLSDAFFAFLEKVVPEWKGDRAPVAHFSTMLPFRLKDVKKTQRTDREASLGDDNKPIDDQSIDEQPGSILENKDENQIVISCLNKQIADTENPTRRIILQEIKEAYLRDEKLLTQNELAKKIQEKTGKSITRQGVGKELGKIRKDLRTDLSF